MTAGRLWVVATPIGNLDDITLRALRVLREADGILAEDTRHSRRLLTHHGVSAPLRSFHAHTDAGKINALVEELVGGARLALITDAGTPLVSDPGIRLVAGAAEAGVPIESVPGASAVTAALTVAGLRCDGFRFVGFLPRTGGRRNRALDAMAADTTTTVIFESPHRVLRTLAELEERVTSDRRVAVCRELTKLHEQVVRGTLSEVRQAFPEGVRGEVTIVLEGAAEGSQEGVGPPTEVVDDEIRRWLAEGMTPRDAAARLAEEAGGPKRDAYQRVLRIRG